jgi:hypothetical protein
MLCGSHPYCDQEAAENRRFCLKHQAQLDRVKATTKRSYNTKAQVAEVIVKKEPPRRLQTQRREQILKALAAGPLNGNQLAKAVGTKTTDRTFSRARNALVKESLVGVTVGEATAKKYYLRTQED